MNEAQTRFNKIDPKLRDAKERLNDDLSLIIFLGGRSRDGMGSAGC